MSATLHLAQTLAEAHPGRAIGYTLGRIAIPIAVIALIVRACRKRRPTPPAQPLTHSWPPPHPSITPWPPQQPGLQPGSTGYPAHPYPLAAAPAYPWPAPQYHAQHPWPHTPQR